MTWFLAIAGVLLLAVGFVTGRGKPRTHPHVAAPESKDEAWAILGQPIERAEEMVRVERMGNRRFDQGLVVGLGAGLIIAAGVTLLPARPPVQPPTAAAPPATPAPGTAATPAPGKTTPAPATGTTPAPTTPAPAPIPAAPAKFTVNDGDLPGTIATNLKAAGLIPSESAFLNQVTARGVDTQLRSGTFTIPAGASVDQVIDALIGS